jgi:hypothetical protein
MTMMTMMAIRASNEYRFLRYQGRRDFAFALAALASAFASFSESLM